MKKFLASFIVLFALLSTSCAQTKTETQKENASVIQMNKQMFLDKVFDYTTGATEWKYQGEKPAVIDFYATWCGPCKYMANSVFTTKEAGDYFNKKFVNIKIDMEKGEGIGLAREFRIQGYPTFIILNSNGKEIGRIVGGAPIKDFIKRVDAILASKE